MRPIGVTILKAIEWLFFNTKTIKTKERNKLENFSGTVLIPVFETTANCSIKFEGLEISSKVFYGKKDTYYLAEKNDNTYVFIGLGKTIDYKSLKTIGRISKKEAFGKMLPYLYQKNSAVTK
jgi:leucyl aminopeptidase